MIKSFIPFLIFLTCFSCSKKESNSFDLLGEWRAELELKPGLLLPFIFHFDSIDGKLRIVVHNAEERLVFDDLKINQDTIFIEMLHYDARISALVKEGEIRGTFTKNYLDNYNLPFVAKKGSFPRFEIESESQTNLEGRWEVHFESEKDASVAEFSQENDILKGTFLTPTGDYRYLEGRVQAKTMKLSTFDGGHAFLFVADLNQDTLRGLFYSGNTWEDPWYAIRNSDIELVSALDINHSTTDSIVAFSFPNEKGDIISLNDPRYLNRPVIIQILGTWCPNCMDEILFLTDWYNLKEQSDPEILGLAFEMKNDLQYASARIKKMKEKLKVNYEVLFAGYYKKDSASKVISFIDKIVSYPTMVFLDKDHRIKHIHTGFTGPGTGDHYEIFKSEFAELIKKIRMENEQGI